MKILTLDVENTMYKHQERNEEGRYNPGKKHRIGSAFCTPQWLVLTGLKWLGDESLCISASDEEHNEIVQANLNEADLVVGFNIKHDLHWLKRAGIENAYHFPVWDCQLAEWMLNNQRIKGKNSLKDACERHGLPSKLDVIENDYWSKGIDTDEIPADILAEYLEVDLDRTERVFLKQCKIFGVNL